MKYVAAITITCFVIIAIVFIYVLAREAINDVLHNGRAAAEDREHRASVDKCTTELEECDRTIEQARGTLRELTKEIRENQKIPNDNK